MIKVTVVPQTRSGYLLPHYGQENFANRPERLQPVIGETIAVVMEAMRERDRDPVDYEYVVRLEHA